MPEHAGEAHCAELDDETQGTHAGAFDSRLV